MASCHVKSKEQNHIPVNELQPQLLSIGAFCNSRFPEFYKAAWIGIRSSHYKAVSLSTKWWCYTSCILAHICPLLMNSVLKAKFTFKTNSVQSKGPTNVKKHCLSIMTKGSSSYDDAESMLNARNIPASVSELVLFLNFSGEAELDPQV